MITMDRRRAREMENSLPWTLDFPVVSVWWHVFESCSELTGAIQMSSAQDNQGA